MRLSATLGNAAAYLLAADRYQEARNLARESLRHARVVGRTRTVKWTLQHLAAIAVLSNDRDRKDPTLARATNLIGFVDGLAGQPAYVRDHTEQQEYDRTISVLREVFDDDELAKLMSAGKEWSEDQAVAEALAI